MRAGYYHGTLHYTNLPFYIIVQLILFICSQSSGQNIIFPLLGKKHTPQFRHDAEILYCMSVVITVVSLSCKNKCHIVINLGLIKLTIGLKFCLSWRLKLFTHILGCFT